MPRELGSQPAPDAWSEPIKGLSGRVRVEFEDLRPGVRHAVFLQMRNHSLNPVAVTDHPQVHAELLDSAGQAVAASMPPTSGPSSHPQWVRIPPDGSIAYRIDLPTVGIPTRERGTVLLALGGKAWMLTAGQYLLKTTLAFRYEATGPDDQWVGNLAAAAVDVIVTPQMVISN
jgi:hypothetical protein